MAFAVVLVAALAVALLGGCGSLADRLLNGAYRAPPYEVDPAAEALHRRHLVVDLHGDVPLRNHDLLARPSKESDLVLVFICAAQRRLRAVPAEPSDCPRYEPDRF